MFLMLGSKHSSMHLHFYNHIIDMDLVLATQNVTHCTTQAMLTVCSSLLIMWFIVTKTNQNLVPFNEPYFNDEDDNKYNNNNNNTVYFL